MQQIKAWFSGLDENEQKITLGFGIVIAVLLVYLMVIEPINNSASKLKTQVFKAQQDVDWMKQQIPLFRANRGAGSRASSLALTSVVNSTTQKYSLPVSRRDSKSANEMQVWFDNVAFDSFLNWVSEIKNRHGVTVTSVNVRSQDQAGITSINVKLLK